MTMLDILENSLPDGLTIVEAKEKPSKYLVKFSYNGERLAGHGELVKACTPGKENVVVDTTIQVAMTGFMLEKGDLEGAKFWSEYVKRSSTYRSNAVSKMNTISFDVNNGRTMKLIQRHHDGKTLLIIEGPDGTHESINDDEAFISPSDFVMLINYYRTCKREHKPIF